MNKIKTLLDEDRDRNVIKLTNLRKTKTSFAVKKKLFKSRTKAAAVVRHIVPIILELLQLFFFISHLGKIRIE